MSANMNQNIQQQTTPTPEDIGGTGRTFTQEEVNRIVSDRLAREREKLADSGEYKAKYEAAVQELESIKTEQTRAAKSEVVRAYYRQKNIPEIALDIVMKGSKEEIDALELDESGKIKDFSAIDSLINGVFSVLVGHTRTEGAQVTHPHNCEFSPDQKIADAFKPKI